MLRFNNTVLIRGLLIGAALTDYACLIFLSAGQPGPSPVVAVLSVLPLVVFALWISWRSRWRSLLIALIVILAVVLRGHGDWLMRHYYWVYFTQHFGAMIVFGAMFGCSLLPGRDALVTRFASMVHDSMSAGLIAYTRRVTWAWTVFFAAMAVVSLVLFLFAPIRDWALFATVLTPLMVIALFVVEYLVRQRALPPDEIVGPIESILAYSAYRAHATAVSSSENRAVHDDVSRSE